MLKNIIALLFFFLCFQIVWAQRKPPIKWGKINQENLKMGVYERDTAAEAVVLCNYGKISVENFGGGEFKYRFVHHKRIKVLKPSGISYGKIQIPYISYQKREWLTNIKGQVFSTDGSVQELDKKKDVFFEKNERYTIAKAAFPNVQVGSIIEFRYEIVSENLVKLRDWAFQESIPTIYSELQVSYPQYYAYSYLFNGGEFMEKSEEDGVVILQSEKGTVKLGKGWFTMENAVALKDPERYITTMDDYIAKIGFQLSKIYQRDGTESSFLSTWEKLAKDLEHQTYFGEQFFKKRYHKKVLEAVIPLVEHEKTDNRKIEILYDYFSRNLETNYGGIWVKKSLDDAFEKKTATFSEANLMLLAALQSLDITAYPLLTSLRWHGRIYTEYPIYSQFNHVMVGIILDGKNMILDLGDKYRPMGYPRVSALNEKGWLMDVGAPKWIQIVPPKAAEIYSLDLELDEKGMINGKMKGIYKGYSSISERYNYDKNKEAKHWKDRFSDKFSDVLIEDVHFGKLDSLNIPFIDEFKLSIPDAAQVVGDFIYFSPVLYSTFDENILKLEKRHYPVDIPYQLNEQYVLKLTIPENYKVEELPQSARYVLPNNGGSFSFAIEQKDDGHIEMISRILVKQLRFSPIEYPNIKELFDLAAEKYGEQIVLKKK